MKKLGILLIGILSVSCGNLDDDIKAQSDAALFFKEWKLTAYETGEVDHTATIAFKTTKNEREEYILSGKCGVNFYEATFVLSGDSIIKILNLSTTEMAGSALIMGFEKDFLDKINNIETFSFENNQLVLSTKIGNKLYFK